MAVPDQANMVLACPWAWKARSLSPMRQSIRHLGCLCSLPLPFPGGAEMLSSFDKGDSTHTVLEGQFWVS